MVYEYSEQRKNDINGEQALNEFLDEYFYPRMDGFEEWKRVNDADKQISGIDVEAVYKRNSIFIDEKGYLSRNKPQKTFAFEISRLIGGGQRKQGWLFDDSLETTHFLICWNKRDEEIRVGDVKSKDFHYITTMLIEKKKLQNYLKERYGIDKEVANQNASILIDGDSSKRTIMLKESDSKYYYSRQLDEKPINLVMDKNELKGISEFYVCIKRKEIVYSK